MNRRYFLFLLPLLVTACAHKGVSKETLRLADRSITYQALREKPEQLAGTYVHLGGTIAGVKNSDSGGELEIVELPLDRSGKPGERSSSGGRFLARDNRFLDPMVYRPGLTVSLVGEVQGQKTAVLDNVQYRYPVVLIKELYVWKPEDYRSASPRFHFGLGFFQGF